MSQSMTGLAASPATYAIQVSAHRGESLRRGVLRLRHSLCTSVADAASGRAGPGSFRQMRPELRYLPAVSVSELRAAADVIAREHRELDVQIQRVNWEADLAC